MNSFLASVIEQLKAAPIGTADKIAAAKGIHKDTILKIRSGKRPNPTIQTLEAIAEYFRETA